MSTRANIVVSDEHGELWFYRHSDGYPEGAKPMLDDFVEAVNDGRVRNNTGQAAGWLIVAGHAEYSTPHAPKSDSFGMEWKCGSIEPTRGQAGDIEYLYRIELDKKPVKIRTFELTDWKTQTFTEVE